MKQGTVEAGHGGLIINGKKEILFGGEFHYFRTPRAQWEHRLQLMRESGINLLATYIPWNVHEEEEGKLDWTGERDLGYFLTLCKQYGFYVIIKPGPYICAEWDFGGFPHWIIPKEIELRLPVPEYMVLVKKWYADVADVIKPHLVTQGGPITLIQVENEYDHLIEFTDLVKDQETAKIYLLTLLQYVREAGIDIPAFTNEGRCILGTEIINTHTYYANIPWIWMWEFNDFDKKIEQSRREQPEKPLMIMELEAGWFAQFGKDIYNVEPELVEAVTKTVLAYGASVLNYYMFAGGTSFLYRPSKGDYGGIGICNSFDFGASPVREWGELDPKYHLLRLLSLFVQTWPDVISDARTLPDEAEFVKGGEEIVRVSSAGTDQSGTFKDSYENLKILVRRAKDRAILMARNLEDTEREVLIRFHSRILGEDCLIPSSPVRLPSRVSCLWPVDFHVDESLVIIWSTSELISRQKIAGRDCLFMRGNENLPGEMLLSVPAGVHILEGKAKVRSRGGEKVELHYSHQDILVVRTQNMDVFILPSKQALGVYLKDDLVLLGDVYRFSGDTAEEKTRTLDCMVRPGHPGEILALSGRAVRSAEWDGVRMKPKKEGRAGFVKLAAPVKKDPGSEIEWVGDWEWRPDTMERIPDISDSDWTIVQADRPLEKSGLTEHGWFWYRHEFDVEKGIDKIGLKIKSNEMDRFTVYVNGLLKWIGIGSPDLDLTDHVKPGKNLIAVCYENAYHTKAHPHEGPIQKVSGLYEPVVFSFEKNGQTREEQVKEWKVQQGLRGVRSGWMNDFNPDPEWTVLPEGKKYVFQEDAGNIVWLRRKFIWKPAEGWETPPWIEIPAVNDRCIIYVNGKGIGKCESIGPQFRFYIPESFLKEENVVSLVVEGPGYHAVLGQGFLPPVLHAPKLGLFYQARPSRLILKH